MSLALAILCFLFFAHTSNAAYSGLWLWTWAPASSTGSTNLNIAFSGWTNPDSAISDSQNVYSKLTGEKYISLGGGNANGRWTSALLTQIGQYCTSKRFSGYTGISFDIEEGDSNLLTPFKNAFTACKAAGYKVLVTVSHSTPYGISDGVALMTGIIGDSHVDILSPQLYSSGTEASNEYTTNGVSWSTYKNFRGAGGVVPSIVKASYYSAAQTYFKSQGITLNGFIQWSQTSVTAVIEDSNSQSSTSLSELQIGLIAGGCVLLVVIVVALVVLGFRKFRKVESV